MRTSVELAAQARDPDEPWYDRPPGRNYLLLSKYRQTSLLAIFEKGDQGCLDYLAQLRWGAHGKNKQVCPACGRIDTHYWCASVKRWACRAKACRKQFTVLSGTRFHNMKMTPTELVGLALKFVEAKDSVSTRELSGLFNLNQQSAYVSTMKFREALRDTMLKEPPLDRYVQADAAYFMKYVRPPNVGTGAALAAKKQQKNAGLDESAKAKQTVSPKMHALVVFAQAGSKSPRRYKVAVVKTENQVDMLALAQQFCKKGAHLVTDQHSAYNVFSGEFDAHFRVNHSEEFMSKEGYHTNHAEAFFSRMRAAQGGARHKLTLQNLEEYGWEFAWRQTVVGKSNQQQLDDLLRRVLTSGRATKFGDYWKTRPQSETSVDREEVGTVVEVSKEGIKKKRGRPTLGTVRPQEPPRVKRKYTRKASQPSPNDAESSPN